MSRVRKKSWRSAISVILVVAIALGVCGAIVSFVKSDTKTIGAGAFTIGSIDSNGEYVATDQSIYTKDAFRCRGLKIVPDFESKVSYSIFFYDFDNMLIKSVTDLRTVYDEDFEVAYSARVMITPDIPDDIEDEEEFKIKFWEVQKYVNDLTIYVDREQDWYDTDNLYDADKLIVGHYFGESFGEYNSNSFPECSLGTRSLTGKIYVNESYNKYDLWVYVTDVSDLTYAMVLFAADGTQFKVDDYYVNETFIGSNVPDRPKWCKLTLKIPELEDYTGVHFVCQIPSDAIDASRNLYVYGYND